MGELILPQPTKNARDIYEITGAVIESIPGVSLLKKFADIHLNRKLEEALKLIAKEVQECGIEVLSDIQYEYYLSSAYRFAEQVRLGDYQHNLKILRRILVDGLKSNSTDSGKIGRHARQLEYLSEFEIDVLAGCFEVKKMKDGDKEDKHKFISSDILKAKIGRFNDLDRNKLRESLCVLYSRGLLIADGVTRYDKEEEYFYMTADATQIIAAAEKQG